MPPARRRRPKSGDPEYPYLMKKYDGKIVRSRFPVFTKPWSAKQKAYRKRLRAASDYAVAVAADPQAVAYYKDALRRKKLHLKWTVRNAAISDFLNPAQLHDLELRTTRGRPGGEFSLYVAKKFQIQKVLVTLRVGGRVLLADAPAIYKAPAWTHTFETLPEGTNWEVSVTVIDRPGNKVTQTLPASTVQVG